MQTVRAVHASAVIATGPWTRPLMQQAGFDPPIETDTTRSILKNAPNMKSGSAVDSVTATYFRSMVDKFLSGLLWQAAH